ALAGLAQDVAVEEGERDPHSDLLPAVDAPVRLGVAGTEQVEVEPGLVPVIPPHLHAAAGRVDDVRAALGKQDRTWGPGEVSAGHRRPLRARLDHHRLDPAIDAAGAGGNSRDRVAAVGLAGDPELAGGDQPGEQAALGLAHRQQL